MLGLQTPAVSASVQEDPVMREITDSVDVSRVGNYEDRDRSLRRNRFSEKK